MSIETQFWFSVTKKKFEFWIWNSTLKKILDFKSLSKKDFGFRIWNQFFPWILDFDLKSFRCRILSNPGEDTSDSDFVLLVPSVRRTYQRKINL